MENKLFAEHGPPLQIPDDQVANYFGFSHLGYLLLGLVQVQGVHTFKAFFLDDYARKVFLVTLENLVEMLIDDGFFLNLSDVSRINFGKNNSGTEWFEIILMNAGEKIRMTGKKARIFVYENRIEVTREQYLALLSDISKSINLSEIFPLPNWDDL